MDQGRELKPINRSFHKSATVFGIDWRIVIVSFMAAAVMFMALVQISFRLSLSAPFAFIAMLLAGKWITRKDIKIPLLYVLAIFQSGYYDPSK